MKRCTRCGEVKPLDGFYVVHRGETGPNVRRRSRCIACVCEEVRQYQRRKSGYNGLLPLGPFRAWLAQRLRQTGCTTALAARIGVDEAWVRRLVGDRFQRFVQMTTVDKFGISLGEPGLVEELYPYDEAEAA